ncbi:MAG TPA: MBOAT family protein [Coriobacteriia bacterium]
MLFSSVSFLFAFLPLAICVYFVAPGRRLKNLVLLALSFVFYAFGGLNSLLVLAFSILMNYLCGLAVDRLRDTPRAAKAALVVGVIANVMLLASFKYLGFLATSANAVAHLSIPIPTMIMPIGVSFFTFEGLSYIVDVYRDRAPVQRNPLDVALYMGLFATIMSGPIVRYTDFHEQIRGRTERLEGLATGAQRFTVGLAKKVIVAGALGTLATSAFALPDARLSVAGAWLGALAFTGQIYFDFSGYSDMAIGLGHMFGFRLPENFNYPYISQSVTEFWRRWHMSLGTWFREYVYIPLGGNRVSRLVNLRNILIVWTLTGLWHGATWSFVVWGAYYGVLMAIEKFVLGDHLERVWRPLRHALTMLAVVVGWVFFKAATLGGAVQYLQAMIGLGGRALVDSQALFYLSQYRFELIVAVVASLPIVPFVKTIWERSERSVAARGAVDVGVAAALGVLLLVSISYILSTTFAPFLYFKF